MSKKNPAARRRPAAAAVRRPMFESLEQRQLMSGTLALTNASGLPATNRLIFNVIQHPNTTTPNATHNLGSVTITNTNTTPLTITSITPSGPFELYQAPAGNYQDTVLAANGSLTVQVRFTQTTLPAHSTNETNYTTNPNGGAAITGSLVVNSSDTANPTTTVALAGYWQNQSENNSEPNLTTIVDTLAGYQTPINNAGNASPDLAEPNGTRVLYGSEVASTSWAAADPARPVAIQTLAEFHTQGNVVHTYFYDTATQTSHLLFSSLPSEGQTLLPHNSDGSLARTTFSPSGNFGFRVDNEYSDDAINQANNNGGGGGHHFRFYPLVGSDGQAVPNTWVVAMDYAVLQTENFDFQDNVFVVGNVRPTNTPPTPTALTATAGATPILNWTEPPYGTLAGYNVYRKLPTDTAFVKLTATPQTATTYTDQAAPGGVQIAYEITAVDGQSSLESQPAAVNANTPGGPVTGSDAFAAYSGQTTVLAVLANDADATGALNPASVSVVATPTSGATVTLNPTTGTLNYTAPAGFGGTDTFQYTVADNNGATSIPTTVTVTVANATTTSPTANADVANVLANTPLAVAVTANDDPVTTLNLASLNVVSQGANGAAVANADGTITYTPNQNFIGADTFTYTVADANGRASNSATVGVNVGVQLNPSAKGGVKTLTYTDSNGTPVTISLNRGAAAVYFSGTGTTGAAAKNGKLAVGGTKLSAADIILANTTAGSVLNIAGARNGKVNLAGLLDAGTIGTINARTTTLAGNLSVAGLNTLNLGSVTANGGGATVTTIGAGTKSTAITLGTVTDASLTTAGPIRSLKVGSWQNTENGTIAVTAPSIASLNVAKQFAPTLNVSGAIGTATVAGSLGTGFWNVGGVAKNVTVGSLGNAWGGSFGGLTTLRVKSGGLPDTLTVGTLGTATITGDLTAPLTVGTAKAIRVTGAFTGASVTVTGADAGRTPSLGTIQVTGAVTNAAITTFGSAQTVRVGSLTNSLVAIGSSATTLAAASAADVGSSTLGNLKVTGRGTTFNASAVIAHTITSASVGQADTAVTAGSEGLAGVTFGSAVIGVDGGSVRLNKAALTDATTLTTYLTAKRQTLGGFTIDFV